MANILTFTKSIENDNTDKKELPLQAPWLQDLCSFVFPEHVPTAPTHLRIRLMSPPPQLAEHLLQEPHDVHAIEGKDGEKHN